jgi:hypothetical protein
VAEAFPHSASDERIYTESKTAEFEVKIQDIQIPFAQQFKIDTAA